MKSVSDILIDSLPHENIEKAMREMETLAKQKYFNVQLYYEKKMLDDDDCPADLVDLVDDTKWQNFLPSEYYKLRAKLDERKTEKNKLAS